MFKTIKVAGLVLSLAALVALSFPLSALADTITIDLTSSNLGSTYPGPFVTLTVTVPSGGGDATVAALGDTSGGFTYNLDELGLNLSTTATASGLPSGWTQSGSQNLAGYGTFNTVVGINGGFPASLNSFTFTLTPSSGSFSDASSVFLAGADPAAAHIFATSSSCTGACATGFASVSAAEPPLLMILGANFLLFGVAVIFLLRRGLLTLSA